MGQLCRITLFAFQDPRVTREDGYDNRDLDNAIDYFEDLERAGFVEEPMDKIPVKEFLDWARKEIGNGY